MTRSRYLVPAAIGLTVAAVALAGLYSRPRAQEPGSAERAATATIARQDFVRTVRLSGTVEAVEATTMTAPRLLGQNNNSLVITALVPAGHTVKPGALLVEFDRQDQVRNALDRQAELNDFDQQIKKRQAEEAAARASDDSTMKQAETALQRAQLEMLKNEMLPKIDAEKNQLALDEAQARLAALKQTYDLKRQAAQADIRVLEIQRDRSADAMREAQSNADRMQVRSPIGGIAVIKTTWKGSGMADIQDGDEVRPGTPVVDVVNPASMRVRARVNQADIRELQVGQPAQVGLDAYPSLHFTGTVTQISPIGVQSSLSPKVRNFVVLIAVNGSHPNLMPDLTAAVDVELTRERGVLLVPRDAVQMDGSQAYVEVRRGGRFERQNVTLGPANLQQLVVSGGLAEGSVVSRAVRAWSGE